MFARLATGIITTNVACTPALESVPIRLPVEPNVAKVVVVDAALEGCRADHVAVTLDDENVSVSRVMFEPKGRGEAAHDTHSAAGRTSDEPWQGTADVAPGFHHVLVHVATSCGRDTQVLRLRESLLTTGAPVLVKLNLLQRSGLVTGAFEIQTASDNRKVDGCDMMPMVEGVHCSAQKALYEARLQHNVLRAVCVQDTLSKIDTLSQFTSVHRADDEDDASSLSEAAQEQVQSLRRELSNCGRASRP